MLKKIITSVLIILSLGIFAGLFYLNEVFLPTNIKASIVRNIEDATGKKVLLDSLRFSIFKGLVLERLIIYDDKNVILNIKKISCRFSSIRVESPVILAERRKDNSINLVELFLECAALTKGRFKIGAYKVIVKDGRVNLNDYVPARPFKGRVDKLNMHIYLSLPDKARFDLDFEIPSSSPAIIDSSGEYEISQKALTMKAAFKNLSPSIFLSYYEDMKFSFLFGNLDGFLNLEYREGLVKLALNLGTEDLVISEGDILTRIDMDVKSDMRYNLENKEFSYSGNMGVKDCALSGIEGIEKVSAIKGDFEFGNNKFSSDNVRAVVFDIPFKGRVNLLEGDKNMLGIYMMSDLKLDVLQKILKDKLKIILPADIEGDGTLNLQLEYAISTGEIMPQIKGSLGVTDAAMKLDKDMPAAGKINGTLQFTSNQATWSGVDLEYNGIDYKTSGTLTNFETPGIQMTLNSKDMSLESIFALMDRTITFSRFTGRYNNSDFSLAGNVDLSARPDIIADLDGAMNIDLDDLKARSKEVKDRLDKIKAKGALHTDFSLKGNVNKLKSCAIDAKFLSTSLSVYGIRPVNFMMEYSQRNGIANITRVHSFLYGGTLDATGRIDWITDKFPYSVSADIKGVRIEKLKDHTDFKDKDIAGAIQANIKMDGFLDDQSRFRGSGTLDITDGRLWQSNLFKGLGALLFTSDFSNIIFKEGHCGFTIEENAISTDDLKLKSGLIDMYGSVRIDFHNSINAVLKAEFTEAAIERGLARNVAAVEQYSLIEISGTLKDPKYKVRPDVGGIIEELKDRFL